MSSRSLHQARSNPRLGLALALATVLLWGFLSIALKFLLLGGMDAVTITWYRLSASALVLLAIQAWRRQLPVLRRLAGRDWSLLAVALLGLIGNYVFFALALDYVPPATAQLVVQLAPLLFLLGGLVIFKETFSRWQWLGLVVLVFGLLLFFNDRLAALVSLSGSEAVGVFLVVIGSIVWAAYALAQKQLLVSLSSENILLLVYIGATVLLFPLASPGQVFDLGGFEVGLLVFGIVNTLAAYGCFRRSSRTLGGLSGECGDFADSPGNHLGGLRAVGDLARGGDRGETRRSGLGGGDPDRRGLDGKRLWAILVGRSQGPLGRLTQTAEMRDSLPAA